MTSLWETVTEMCAGRGPSEKLYKRILEQQYQDYLKSQSAIAIISEDSAVETTSRTSPATSSATTSSTTSSHRYEITAPDSDSRASCPQSSTTSFNRHSSSLSSIPERARKPLLQRAQRSCLSFDDLGPPNGPEEYSPQQRPHSADERPEKKFLYLVPPLPEMVGWGRYRRSATATEEWVQESLEKELEATTPLLRGDGFEIPGCPSSIFRRSSSNDSASSISLFNGEPEIDPVTGSVITRGFFSASSSCGSEGLLMKTGLSVAPPRALPVIPNARARHDSPARAPRIHSSLAGGRSLRS
ncbi:MAG: hypothetical protein M1827_006437 [Pycnora praestabilis]|nr:MAG: hypothetical protein M1827_006437 [Pycnora praestabilis]